MHATDSSRDALGLLSVALALLAAVIYIAQTLRGEVRPHPLSWFLFGVLSLTGYWVQRDQGARQGSWTLLAMTIICFLFVAAAGAVFAIYMFSRNANVAAALTTAVDAARLWPHVRARVDGAEKGQRHEFRAQWGEVRSVADGDGPDFVRHLVLSGDGARSQHCGRDHAAHAQARVGVGLR